MGTALFIATIIFVIVLVGFVLARLRSIDDEIDFAIETTRVELFVPEDVADAAAILITDEAPEVVDAIEDEFGFEPVPTTDVFDDTVSADDPVAFDLVDDSFGVKALRKIVKDESLQEYVPAYWSARKSELVSGINTGRAVRNA